MSWALLEANKEHCLRNHGLMIAIQSPHLMSVTNSATLSKTTCNKTSFTIGYLM